METTEELVDQIRIFGDTLVEAQKYALPKGFKKPKSYPGLAGLKHENALAKGYVDLGLLDGDLLKKMSPGGPALKEMRALILKHIVKLLVGKPGKTAYVRDPENVLGVIYKGFSKNVQSGLVAHIEEALEAMFDKPVKVTVGSFMGKTGWGWRFKSKELAGHLKA